MRVATRQPQGAARLNYPGAVTALLPTSSYRGTSEGGILRQPGPGGIGWKGDATDNIYWETMPAISAGATFGGSLLVVHSGSSASGVLGAIGRASSSAGDYFFISKAASGQVHLQIADNAGLNSASADSTGVNVGDGGVHCTIATYSASLLFAYLYVDGKYITSAGSGGWTSTVYDRISAGGLRRASSGLFGGDTTYLVVPFDRYLSSAEATYLSRNPWSLFLDPPRPLYTGSGSGSWTPIRGEA